MPNVLCITIQFLDPEPGFHGKADGGEPEWPPSPLRLFQALVDAAASRWRAHNFDDSAKPILIWLEKLAAPTIIAPAHHVGVPVRIAVPNNDLDVWAGPLSRGVEPKKQPNTLKTMKPVRTTRLRPTRGGTMELHYLFRVTDPAASQSHFETLRLAARSVTHLGWGVDMVAGNAELVSEEAVAKLAGERWQPVADGSGTRLRVPTTGTLQALMEKHTAFLNRLSGDGFRPVPPLTAFDVVGYRRDTDSAPRPVVAFELRTPDFERFQPYCAVRRTPAVAGMVRHAVAELAKQMRPFGWTEADINRFVHGHTADGTDRARGADADDRFAYLPLPSLEYRGDRGVHVGQLRRVLLVAPPNRTEWATWARVLSGQELTPEEGTAPAALRLIDGSPAALRDSTTLGPYLRASRVWSTVTPVVLPGHDDRDPAKAEGLLRRALAHAGLPSTEVQGTLVEFRGTGFRAGVDMASRYAVPDHTHGARYHVRVRFAQPVTGPLCVGKGRYRGLGLFATDS